MRARGDAESEGRVTRVVTCSEHQRELRADRELRAVKNALNFTQGKRHASWRDYLDWLEVSVESAMRHAVRS